MAKVPGAWNEYVTQLDAAKQKALLDTLDVALATINEPECVMSYGVPTIKSNDKYIIAAGAYKNFLSLYPFGDDAIEANYSLFEHNEKSKGAVRFRYSLLPTTEQISAIVQWNSNKQ